VSVAVQQAVEKNSLAKFKIEKDVCCVADGVGATS
jgi:hypothetical protein